MFQVLVVLESAGEQVADEEHHVVVEAAGMPLLDRSIVFVDDHHGLDAVVVVQHLGEHHQRKHEVVAVSLALRDFLIEIEIGVLGGGKLAVALVLHADQHGDQVVGFCPGSALDILEGQEDHRVLALMRTIGFTTGPDFPVGKIPGSVLSGFLEVCPQHIHVQRLAETAGTGKQGHHGHLIQKVTDHQRFVDVVILG